MAKKAKASPKGKVFNPTKKQMAAAKKSSKGFGKDAAPNALKGTAAQSRSAAEVREP